MRPELAQAIELLASKDAAQINEAVRLLQNTVYSFAMKVCGHREDAEDTAQEVLFKALPHLAKLEDPRALAVWLYTVARNQCWMARRKSKFAPTQAMTLDALMPDDHELQMLLADPGRSPEDSAIERQDHELLQKAVLNIPPKYRLILVLHDMEELDTVEIAKVTLLKEGTVRVRLHRARLLLRRELAQVRAAGGTRQEGKRSRGRVLPRKRPAGCREMFANISEYLDHRVDGLSCEEMQKHIENCPPCVAFIRDLEKVVERCRTLDAGCAPETNEALRHVLTQEYLRLLEPNNA
jgi:RNA polymerase sigma-70 factor (ECF subfamily)